jgi:hypothetical protein
MDGLGTIIEDLNQDIRSYFRDLKLEPQEYETLMLISG